MVLILIQTHLRGVDGNLHIDSRLKGNSSDLLDNRGRADQIDESLVDSHLITVPGVGTLTTGRLAGSDNQSLGGETGRTTDSEALELLLAGGTDEFRAD